MNEENPAGPNPLASTPPGSTPPGSTPPGSTPPGSTPPGSTPPGSTPPGSTPPGSTPPGSTPPGSTPPGSTPPGSTPPGSTPPGSTPPGSTPPGSTPPGLPNQAGDAAVSNALQPSGSDTTSSPSLEKDGPPTPEENSVWGPVFHGVTTTDIARLDAKTRRRMRPSKRQFAWLGGLAAVTTALLLELLFGLFGVGDYFYNHATKVVMFQQSVQQATRDHLGTGDVQLTLRWKGVNDLDIHCIDPNGNEVSFHDRQSPSGGRLDLDMNANEPPWSPDGIENIYWPFGAAPAGTYRVMVHHYRRNGGLDNEPFTLRVLNRGGIKTVVGSALYVPPALGQEQGNQDGLDAVNLTAPVEVARFTVTAPPRHKLFLTWAPWIAVLVSALWVAALSAAIACAVLSGLNGWYASQSQHETATVQGQRIPPFFADKRTVQWVVWRAFVWGALFGGLVQLIYWALAGNEIEGGELWRWLAWIALATLVGGRCGQIIPFHLPPREGRKGGNWGGAFGGFLFSSLSTGNGDGAFFGADAVGRMVASAIIGAWIGYMVVLPLLDSLPQTRDDAEEDAPAPVEKLPAAPLLRDLLIADPKPSRAARPPAIPPTPPPSKVVPPTVGVARDEKQLEEITFEKVETEKVEPLVVERATLKSEPILDKPILDEPVIPARVIAETPPSAPPVSAPQSKPVVHENPVEWLYVERRIGRRWNGRATPIGRRRRVGRSWAPLEEVEKESQRNEED